MRVQGAGPAGNGLCISGLAVNLGAGVRGGGLGSAALRLPLGQPLVARAWGLERQVMRSFLLAVSLRGVWMVWMVWTDSPMSDAFCNLLGSNAKGQKRKLGLSKKNNV